MSSVDFSGGRFPSDEDGPALPAFGGSLFDRINADIEERKAELVTLTHPAVPKLAVTFRVPSDRTEIEKITERARAERAAGQEPDEDASIIARFAVQIAWQGEVLREGDDPEGRPLTFTDKELRTKLGIPEGLPRDAVKKLYGRDGVVSAIVSKLTDAGSFGSADEVVSEDPTHAG